MEYFGTLREKSYRIQGKKEKVLWDEQQGS
jgi:hypothetical protein